MKLPRLLLFAVWAGESNVQLSHTIKLLLTHLIFNFCLFVSGVLRVIPMHIYLHCFRGMCRQMAEGERQWAIGSCPMGP